MSKYPAPEHLVRIAFEILLTSICSECRGAGIVRGMGIGDVLWSAPCGWCDGTGIDPADLEGFCCLEEAAPAPPASGGVGGDDRVTGPASPLFEETA